MAAYGLPPSEVEAIVRSMGLRPIAPPLRRPRVYVVDAVDARGFRVRAIVHARRGDVLAVRPVYVAPPRYAAYPVHPRYGAVVTPDDDDIDVDVNVDVDVDVDVDLDRDERRPPVSSVAPPRTPRIDSATRAAKPSVQPSVKSAKADPAATPTPRPRPAGADARAECADRPDPQDRDQEAGACAGNCGQAGDEAGKQAREQTGRSHRAGRATALGNTQTQSFRGAA
jgi:hypothetical protein